MGRVHGQVRLSAFMGLCLAGSIGLLAAQHAAGIKDMEAFPEESAPVFELVEKTTRAAESRFTQLQVGGALVDFGDEAKVTFTTDAKGRGSFGLRVARNDRAEGSPYPMAVSWKMPPKSLLSVGGERVQVSGLEPDARYEMMMAFWERDAAGFVRAPSNAYPECAGGCVAAFGVPRLRAVGPGAKGGVLERVEVSVLGSVPWGSPLMLGLGAVLLRRGQGRTLRRVQAALGVVPTGPMPVSRPKVG